MKLFQIFIFTFLFASQNLVSSTRLRWPTEKTPPAKKLPSLEVRVAPPQEYQPKVQAEIKLLDTKRETAEYKMLESLEKKYNEELVGAGKKFKGVIDNALKVFDNPALLKSSVKAAKNPPSLQAAAKKKKIIGFLFKEKENLGPVSSPKIHGLKKSQEIQKELINEDNSSKMFRSDDFFVQTSDNYKKHIDSLNFEEKPIASVGLTNESFENSQNTTINTNTEYSQAEISPKNNIEEPDQKNNVGFLQMTEKMQSGGGKDDDGVPLPPILVKIYDAKEPDQKVQTEMDKLEKERGEYEKKMFTMAEKELKLITAQTVQELQSNLESELMPFFVASKNVINDITSALSKGMGSMSPGGIGDTISDGIKNIAAGVDKVKGLFRFAEKNDGEMRKFFPIFMKTYDQYKNSTNTKEITNSSNSKIQNQNLPRFIEDGESSGNPLNVNVSKADTNKLQINLGQELDKYVNESQNANQQEIQNKKSLNDENEPQNIKNKINGENENQNSNNENSKNGILKDARIDHEISKNEKEENDHKFTYEISNEKQQETLNENSISASNSNEERAEDPKKLEENKENSDKLPENINILSPEVCEDLMKKYPFIDFGCKKISATSFLQTKAKLRLKAGGGGADNVNVKVGASETPYPTVYRLIYEMENRRDLAEKWERLKILEFEMNLQKAEDEMIKDALHQGLAKVLAKFGPAIEGTQENIR